MLAKRRCLVSSVACSSNAPSGVCTSRNRNSVLTYCTICSKILRVKSIILRRYIALPYFTIWTVLETLQDQLEKNLWHCCLSLCLSATEAWNSSVFSASAAQRETFGVIMPKSYCCFACSHSESRYWHSSWMPKNSCCIIVLMLLADSCCCCNLKRRVKISCLQLTVHNPLSSVTVCTSWESTTSFPCGIFCGLGNTCHSMGFFRSDKSSKSGSGA